jgi:hypothetical protein
MADNSYVEETPDDLVINAVRDILAVKTLLNGTFFLRTQCIFLLLSMCYKRLRNN